MGFKQLIAIFLILLLFATYIVGGAEKISIFIEKYSEEKYQEPLIEKIAYYNINYVYFMAKYKRTLELIDKFINKYNRSQYVERILFLKAKTYDKMLQTRTAIEEYKKYIDDYPEGKYKNAAERRCRELLDFY